jgi:hypothetical protein
MDLKHLTAEEMVAISTAWVEEATAEHQHLMAIPELRVMMPYLQDAHERLLHNCPPAPQRLQDLAQEADQVDLRHDVLVRGVYSALTSVALLTLDPERANQILRLQALLFPEGLSLIQKPYREEAQAARQAQARLTATQHELLEQLPAPGGTMKQAVEQWFDLARQLGDIEQESAQEANKQAIAAAAELIKARNKWIHAINALLATIPLLDLSGTSNVLTTIPSRVHHAAQQALTRTITERAG